MKKNIFKKVAIFGACLCAPLMFTGCDQSESKTDFRVHNGFIQSTTDGTNWKNLVPLEDLKGVDGTNSVSIGADGYWYINGENTGVKARGEDGEKGNDGRGIQSVDITYSDEYRTIYTITYTDGSTYSFDVYNGQDGADGNDGIGIKSIEIDADNTNEEVTMYKITFDDDSTYYFQVWNGQDGINGTNGKDGSVVTIGPDGYWYIDGEKTDVKAKGEDGTNGKDANGRKSITIDQNKSDETKTTYIITFDDNTTSSYEVKNGTNGTNGKDGSVVTIGPDGYWYIDGEKTDVKAKGEDGTNGTNGVDASYATYTITYDYGVADTFFIDPKTTDTIKSTEWITALPAINSEYEESFLGWFISGTDKKIENYDFIGGNVTLEARFDIKTAPSGLYNNGKYVKTWDDILDEYPEVFITDGVMGVKDYNRALQDISGELVIDNSITTITKDAISYDVELESIIIPSSVTSIARGFFSPYSSQISTIIVKEGNPEYDSRNNCNAVIETETDTLIQGSIKTIIPDSVKVIGNRALVNSNITALKIPNGVERIEEGAFLSCKYLTDIYVPSSVVYVDCFAFAKCSNLQNIIVEEGNTTYDSRDNCNAIIETETNTIVVGSSNTSIPNNVTVIGRYAFSGNELLTSIIIPSSVQIIRNNAFDECYNINSIVVEEGNTIYDSRDNCNAIIETATNKLILTSNNTMIPNNIEIMAADSVCSWDASKPFEIVESVIAMNSTFVGDKVTNIIFSSSQVESYNDVFGGLDSYFETITINTEAVSNNLVEASSIGYILRYHVNNDTKIYIKSGLEVSNSTYLLEEFTKQTTSDKEGYDMYVRNAE